MSEQSESGKKGPNILPRLAAMLIIGILIGAAVGYLIESPSVAAERSRADSLATQVTNLQNQVTQLEAVKVYTIGASFPITGQLAAIGSQFQAAAQMAIEDLNNQTARLNIRFNLVVEDDKTTDEGALSAVQTMAQAGVQVILGPAASSQVKACKSYVDDNKIVLISPSSTAPTLAIPGDYIFRTVGSDAGQSKALARLAYDQGARNVIVFARDDEYGVAFGQFFKSAFEQLNGTVDIMNYASGGTDFASEVAQLSAKVASEHSDAVIMITFDTDGANILSHAKGDTTLQNVRWFSSEGIHGTPQLTDPAIAAFIQKVKLYGTRPLFKGNPLDTIFKERLKARTGVDPGVFTENVYDSVFLAGWSIIQGGYNGTTIWSTLPKVAQNFYGPSGWCALDENGDKLTQDYAIWTVSPTAGGFAYQDVGSYSGGSITWG